MAERFEIRQVNLELRLGLRDVGNNYVVLVNNNNTNNNDQILY